MGRITDRLARHRERLALHEAGMAAGFFPYFLPMDEQSGPLVRIEGADRLMLGSNNYLGLAGDARVKAAAHDALDRYGAALTGSRLLNGTTPLHEELERELAELMGTEDAMVFTTGYQANCGLLASIAESGDAVVCDSADHASILDGVAMSGAALLPFRHGRLDRLESTLRRAREAHEHVLVVVDGVYSMEGGVADVPGALEVCDRYGASLVVDEAHGVGVLGPGLAGACDHFGVADRVEVRTATLSKSLASCGGFVAGPADLLAYLRVDARSFIFSAAAVPAAVGAALAAVRICRSHEGHELAARALANAARLRGGLVELGYRVLESAGSDVETPIVSVAVGEEVRAMCLWRALYDAGVYVNVSVYPAVPRNRALLRTSVMATHQPDHVDRALAAFQAVRDEAAAGFFTEVA